MSDIKLKYYNVYIKRLDLFAKAIGVKIVIKGEGSDGIWLPRSRIVKIGEDMGNSEEIATILHELGHSLDDVLIPAGILDTRIYKAYRAFYKNRATKNQSKLVIKCEKKAWNYGRIIAHRLKIRLGKWYNQIEKESLKSYENS